MEGLDPVKRMEADPNYINAVCFLFLKVVIRPQNNLNIQFESGNKFVSR